MRRRPPVTVGAYLALLGMVMLATLIDVGPHPAWFIGAAVVGAIATGLYLAIRLVWMGIVAFHAANLIWALTLPTWPGVVVAGVALALLLAPPTRRYFFRATTPAVKVPRGRAMRIGVVVLAGLLLALVAGAALFPPNPVAGDLEHVRSDRPGTRVLLIGNSLVSDLPDMLSRLGEGDRGAPPIFAVRFARRGWTLQDALDDERLIELLEDERWDRVVLQEHTQRVTQQADRETRTLPAVTRLERMARQAGAATVLFANPGYEDGDPRVERDRRVAMHARATQGATQLARRLGAGVAPVGLAWEHALRDAPDADLWKRDGRRPSRVGSYLSACVLYAILTSRDPAHSSFTAGLHRAELSQLHSAAREAVRELDPTLLPRR